MSLDFSADYTDTEKVVLSILKENLGQETSPTSLLMQVAETAYSTENKSVATDVLGPIDKVLLLLVAEGLVSKVEGYDAKGVHTISSFEITRDGLRVARTLNSNSRK